MSEMFRINNWLPMVALNARCRSNKRSPQETELGVLLAQSELW